MIKLKNFGLLEILVSISILYVVSMLIWTVTTREGVLERVNSIKTNHKNVVNLLNNEIEKCSQDSKKKNILG